MMEQEKNMREPHVCTLGCTLPPIVHLPKSEDVVPYGTDENGDVVYRGRMMPMAQSRDYTQGYRDGFNAGRQAGLDLVQNILNIMNRPIVIQYGTPDNPGTSNQLQRGSSPELSKGICPPGHHDYVPATLKISGKSVVECTKCGYHRFLPDEVPKDCSGAVENSREVKADDGV
jgi:hypothetical protein